MVVELSVGVDGGIRDGKDGEYSGDSGVMIVLVMLVGRLTRRRNAVKE